jgi:hypothetical protein
MQFAFEGVGQKHAHGREGGAQEGEDFPAAIDQPTKLPADRHEIDHVVRLEAGGEQRSWL